MFQWILKTIAVLCAAMCIFTAGYAIQYLAGLSEGRTGAHAVQERQPWLSPGIRNLAHRIDNTIPKGAKALIDPKYFDPSGFSPMTRWYLYLNYHCYPLELYVRLPALSSGTVATYREWLTSHFPRIESRGGLVPSKVWIEQERRHAEEVRAASERGIEWTILYPHSADFTHEDIEILHKGQKKELATLDQEESAAETPARVPSMAAALVFALALWLTGHGILIVVKPGAPGSVLEKNATAFLLGWAAVPALAILFATATRMPLNTWVGRCILFACALVGAVFFIKKKPPLRPVWEKPKIWIMACLIVVGFFVVFALFYGTSTPMHRFDALFHFAYKGKLLYHEGVGTPAWTDLDGAVGRIHTHPTYPLGLPAAAALVSATRGAFDENALKMMMPLLMLAGAALLWCSLRPRGRVPALIGVLLWMTLPILYFSDHPHASTISGLWGFLGGGADAWSLPMPSDLLDGCADLPLAVLLLGAFYYLRLGDGLIGGMLLGGAVLTKNEGLSLAVILLLSLALTRGDGRRSWRSLGLALGLALSMATPWLLMKQSIPTLDENYLQLLKPSIVMSSLDRSPKVLGAFGSATFDVVRWGGVWIFFLVAFLKLLHRPRSIASHPVFPAFLVVIGAFMLYFIVLLVSPWDLRMLFVTLIPDRLMLHVTPMAILAATSIAFYVEKSEEESIDMTT